MEKLNNEQKVIRINFITKEIMEYSKCFLDLLKDPRWEREYISASEILMPKILIVGKECAIGEDDPLFEITFGKNWESWALQCTKFHQL